jgi:UDP-N-acetylglucosamine 4-epimerase
MRFVVTGGAGFIGSHLAEHLAAAGHDVVVLDNFLTGKRANLDGFAARVELIVGSIGDLETCRRAVDGAEIVLHQAALPSVPRSVQDPATTHDQNATGTLNMLIAARDAGVRRFVYASSSSAYGDTRELPKRESMQPRPMSPYAVSKLAGEQYCRAFHASYGLETVALRYFNVFGARQDPQSQYGAVVPKFIAAALRNEAPVIYGDGEATRDFTHVSNVVHANLLAVEAPPQALGEVFNVGCGQRVTVNEIWRLIASLVGVTMSPRYQPARTGDVRDSLASLDAITRVLGYTPCTALEEGLGRTIESFDLLRTA